MKEPFPRILRWALLGPVAIFALSWLVAIVTKGNNETAGFWLAVTGVAAVIEIIAVPAAIFLLVSRASRYGSVGNILMTLVAVLPILPALLFVLLVSGKLGTFHL